MISGAQRITHFREAAGLRKVDVSRGLGVSRATVTQWEQGTCWPRPYNFTDLCDLFGVTPSQFYGPIKRTATKRK